MDQSLLLRDPTQIPTPALLFLRESIADNLDRMLAIAGSPERLRPHAKTHKTREIAKMAMAAGIRKHKCATLAEAEMLAQCSVPDVLLAYPMIGPNCDRFALLVKRYPETHFLALVDHPLGIESLGRSLAAAGVSVEVLLDIDVGQHRTGVAPGENAVELYQQISRTRGLRTGGLQVYDGHNHQEPLAERQAAVAAIVASVRSLLGELRGKGLDVPRIVAGGTPTFPVWARVELPGLECSPGTCILHDHGYGSHFPDLNMKVAAVMLTRVVSRPTAKRVTLDLGTKALASDPPAGQRCRILDVPDARFVAHNEEHLVFECGEPERFQPGDVAYVIPTHICPTVALHRQALVVHDGLVVDRWEIVARDRMLTV